MPRKEKKHKCISCGEYTKTDLELDDGKFICETCAQIQGELADM